MGEDSPVLGRLNNESYQQLHLDSINSSRVDGELPSRTVHDYLREHNDYALYNQGQQSCLYFNPSQMSNA